MTIRYPDGRTVEGAILSRTETAMRVAIRGSEDVAEFVAADGGWRSEHWGPVEVEFAWQRHGQRNVIAEADCICPGELASRLIDLLLNESGDDHVADGKVAAARRKSRGQRVA